jgi:hypothetical protein
VHFALILAALLFHAKPSAASTPNETAATSALFVHYETVFRTVPSLLEDASPDEAIGFAREPFGYLVFALDHRSRQLRSELLNNSESILLGTKDYLPPDGLGRVVSTRCYVAVLQSPSRIAVSKYLGNPNLRTQSGLAVWTWTVDLGEFGDRTTHKSSIYVTELGSTYFLVSNNLDELQSTSQGIGLSTEQVPQIREWDSVRQHEFWGYRKLRSPESRPLATIFNGLRGIPPEAEALILYVDFDHKSGLLRIVSSNADDQTARKVSITWKMPPPRSDGRGQWDILFTLTGSGSFPESSFQVLWLFGLGVAA